MLLGGGSGGCGKTSLMNAFFENKFEQTQATIGLDYKTKLIGFEIKGNPVQVHLQIWDSSGLRRF